eukprot:CAMPEP_0178660922 /NCGR_PEP_ID=MMETSP0698-20121128/27415_1 /TAXON_ID=265572 /ORGANISM="Extubocellulus spinifer, Strain CCMP396" /LENGTH=127 /DNA_ID=CAMNT_0020303675 /DNA_START=214 /DNA_END=597 /DNA_ORIENTATION=+
MKEYVLYVSLFPTPKTGTISAPYDNANRMNPFLFCNTTTSLPLLVYIDSSSPPVHTKTERPHSNTLLATALDASQYPHPMKISRTIGILNMTVAASPVILRPTRPGNLASKSDPYVVNRDSGRQWIP